MAIPTSTMIPMSTVIIMVVASMVTVTVFIISIPIAVPLMIQMASY